MSVAPPSLEESPHQLRAVASNSSLASGASLSRRPRTRGRSKTITRSTSPNPATNAQSEITGNTGYLEGNLVEEPLPNSSNSLIMVQAHREEPNMVTESRKDADRLEAPELIRLSKAAQQASHLSAIKTGYKPPPSAFSRVPLSQIERDGVNFRDSVLTQDSEITQQTHSTIYPASTISASTPSPRSPAYLSVDMPEPAPDMDESGTFDEDDVSYRLRLLVNNNYFLPPAHAKPLPNQLAPAPATLPKKPPTPTGFLDLFRLGKSKSKPSTPTSESNLTFLPALRTTSDATAVSGFTTQIQPPVPSSTSHPSRPSNLSKIDRPSRVVVVREKMADLAVAAKQAEMEMKARPRDTRLEIAVMDDVIDPTDSVDLPLPSSGYPFAVQTSALHGLGVSESIGAAALEDHLPLRSPDVSSLDPEEVWKRALLKAAVGHSFDNLNAAAEGRFPTPPRSPMSPASSSMSSMPISGLSPKPTGSLKLEKRIISSPINLDSNIPSSSRSLTHSTGSHSKTPVLRPRGMSSPVQTPIPFRTETPGEPLEPLVPPPRRQFINPVYSLSQTDLTETAGPAVSSSSHPRRSQSSNQNVARKMASSPTLSDEFVPKALPMTPPPIPRHRASKESSLRSRESSERDPSRPSGRRPATPDSISVSSAAITQGEEQNADDVGVESSRASTSLSISAPSALSPTTSAFQDALSRNPSELNIADEHAPIPPIPSGSMARSSYEQSETVTAPTNRKDLTITPPPLRSSSPLPLEPLSPPPRTTSHQYRELRNRQLSSTDNRNSPSAYHSPPPPSLTHRSASDHGHGTYTPPRPNAKRRPPTAPADSTSRNGRSPSPGVQFHSGIGLGIEILEIAAPEPTTPPLPSLLERRQSNGAQMMLHGLHIPRTVAPPEIHSAPAPSSPTSFFDTIQTHPNVMDFLDESDDDEDISESGSESDEEEEGTAEGEGAHSIAHSTYSSLSAYSVQSTPGPGSGRPSLMRLGNHSTPHVSRNALNETDDFIPRSSPPPPPLPQSLEVGDTDRMRPIGNIAQPNTPSATFFAKKIRDVESPLDLYQYTRQQGSSRHPHARDHPHHSRGPSSAGGNHISSERQGRGYGNLQPNLKKGQESEKLDGILRTHMEAEKERIKRMAERLKQAQALQKKASANALRAKSSKAK